MVLTLTRSDRPRMVRRTPQRRRRAAKARAVRAIGGRNPFSVGLCIAPYDGGPRVRSRYSKCHLKDFAYRVGGAAGRFEPSPVAHIYIDSDCTRDDASMHAGHP
ncbi:hypothetical protein Bcen2424_5901 [Burkholderia cenocepacia HI2424]|nr:hypothetical protein Bcen2424_5901 [Burkholderia cenocepacia HI2424]